MVSRPPPSQFLDFKIRRTTFLCQSKRKTRFRPGRDRSNDYQRIVAYEHLVPSGHLNPKKLILGEKTEDLALRRHALECRKREKGLCLAISCKYCCHTWHFNTVTIIHCSLYTMGELLFHLYDGIDENRWYPTTKLPTFMCYEKLFKSTDIRK